ncbi:MAG: hypothetical protein JAZ11_00230 [Candidatus Thiodiazotropha lotti]|nr:hypothetical protein [Candidatus Thiodiazotropha lotti]
MTDQANNQTNLEPKSGNARPSHIVRKKVGRGKRAEFETLGVAWDRGDGSLYVKPYGTQIIEGGFYVFPVSADQESGQ